MMSGYVDLWELLLEPFVDSIGSRQDFFPATKVSTGIILQER